MPQTRPTHPQTTSAGTRAEGPRRYLQPTHVVVSFNGTIRRLGVPHVGTVKRTPFGQSAGVDSPLDRTAGRGRSAWFASRLYSARIRRWAAAVQRRGPSATPVFTAQGRRG